MTKLIKTNEDFEPGFPPPAPGKYRWEILDDITFVPNVNGKMFYKIPLKIDEPIPGEGEDEAKGAFGTRRIYIESSYGENEMNLMINHVGIFDLVIDRFGDDVDFCDDKFAEFLKLKLVGKFLIATHKLRKWTNDEGDEKQTPEFLKFFMPTGKGTAAPATLPTETSNESGDW